MAYSNLIVVGLGNPGAKYAGTRHNIGFEFIDTLCATYRTQLGPGKGPYYVGKTSIKGCKVHLVKPTTFMNNSGQAVRHVSQWFKIDVANCLICYDDLHLAPGTIRLRPGGSAGGHNGIKDIIQQMGTPDVPRLRLGIGDDFAPGRQVDYVLSSFDKTQRQDVDIALQRSIDALELLITDGMEAAMNAYN